MSILTYHGAKPRTKTLCNCSVNFLYMWVMSGKGTTMATLDKYDFIQCRLLKIYMTLSITISVTQTHDKKATRYKIVY